MWKLFYTNDENFLNILKNVDIWKAEIFQLIQNEIKQYFAKKVVTYFDNNLMFNKQNKDMHHSLLGSLALSEEEMQNVYVLFNKIEIYIIKEDIGATIITFGLENKYNYLLEKYNINLIKEISINDSKLIKLKNKSYGILIFDIELVNYALNWLSWAPSLEERAKLQTKHLLVNNYIKSNANLSLKDKVKFESNIESHPKYNEIYKKLYRLMPKIENQLEEEWKNTVEHNKLDINFGKIKSKKI